MKRGYDNYDKFPCIKVNAKAYSGFFQIRDFIKNNTTDTVVIDCYPEVDSSLIRKNIEDLFDFVALSDECAYSMQNLTDRMKSDLTDDRIFGVMTTRELIDFFDREKINQLKSKLDSVSGKKLIIGVGALLICDKGSIFHASIARWEIQQRFRKGLPNWNCNNCDEDPLTKFKRGYFCEWRIADKHKVDFNDKIQYYIDANQADNPKLITKEDYQKALDKTVERPFRVVPYFDPGVWGGQWMKEVCNLDKSQNNFAWCFDCVPEENSMYYDFDGVRVEMPAIDLVLYRSIKLLGDRVQARFGNEFPIRFDFLDTMEGGNLSLQVHPTTEYIQRRFNMHYTQDESYYILDCKEDASVYLGLKENVNKDEFISDLQNAQQSGQMDVEKYVNKWHVKKHDHLLIPAGTIHCSGANSMVLEISSTPYIFTFKLWDWGRVGLDGKPRPINIKHGQRVIDFNRDTAWVKKNLIGQIEEISKSAGVCEQKTGLHKREFIETRRHFFSEPVLHKNDGSVCVLNLVEGEEAEVISPDGKFEPYTVHYAETFIVPDSAGDFIIQPTQKSKGTQLATIKAYVR